MIETKFPYTCTIISNQYEVQESLENIIDKINKGIGEIDTKSLSSTQLVQLNHFIQECAPLGKINYADSSKSHAVLNIGVSGQWTIYPPSSKYDKPDCFTYSFCFRSKKHLDKFLLYSTLGSEYTILEH